MLTTAGSVDGPTAGWVVESYRVLPHAPKHRCLFLMLTTLRCRCAACAVQGQQAGGLVEGHASVEDLIESADGFAEVFPEHKVGGTYLGSVV